MPMMDRTPPNINTVATAAETASSSRLSVDLIDSPPLAEHQLRGTTGCRVCRR